MSKINMRLFFKSFAVMIMAVAALAALAYTAFPSVRPEKQTISSYGSRGAEVRAIQERLKERGLFNEDITGYYGEKTREAVLRFQKQQGISQTGTAGPVTLKALGISVGDLPPATESNIYLLARIISAEARGEPYVGQVAVGAVVLNRIEHPSFPDTLFGVIYQNNPIQYQCTVDGHIYQPYTDLAWEVAEELLTYGTTIPENVLFQSEFLQGNGVYQKVGNTYFCWK